MHIDDARKTEHHFAVAIELGCKTWLETLGGLSGMNRLSTRWQRMRYDRRMAFPWEGLSTNEGLTTLHDHGDQEATSGRNTLHIDVGRQRRKWSH